MPRCARFTGRGGSVPPKGNHPQAPGRGAPRRGRRQGGCQRLEFILSFRRCEMALQPQPVLSVGIRLQSRARWHAIFWARTPVARTTRASGCAHRRKGIRTDDITLTDRVALFLLGFRRFPPSIFRESLPRSADRHYRKSWCYEPLANLVSCPITYTENFIDFAYAVAVVSSENIKAAAVENMALLREAEKRRYKRAR